MDVKRTVWVKDEMNGDEGKDGAYGWSVDVTSEFTRASLEARDRVREAVLRIVNKAGLTSTAAVHATSSRTCGGPQALRLWLLSRW